MGEDEEALGGDKDEGEFCLLAGDLNKLVGDSELGVPGNSQEVSLGGRLLRELLATKDWVLVNGQGSEVVQGGPFTRKDPATGGLSCLDLWVVSRELYPYVKTLVIDTERKMTPARAVKEKKTGKYKLVYTDHYSSLLTFENLPRAKEKEEEKRTLWNIAKENGWSEYETYSNEFSEKLEKVVENENMTIEEVMNKFEKIHDKIKFKAFGKVTIGTQKRKVTRQNGDSDDESEEAKAKTMFEEQEKVVEKELQKISETKNGKAGKIWAIRKKVIGGKKGDLLATAIEDPATKKLITNRNQIKDTILEYCIQTLSNNEPEERFKDEIKKKREYVQSVVENKEGTFEATRSTFEMNIKKFKQSGKKNYLFLTKAGVKFQNVVYKMCKRMLEQEVFPEAFNKTTLHIIYKGKGRREDLSSNRFVHCKEWWPRVAESLVVEDGLKGPLLEGSSVFQIGGQPGHRSEELVFVLKSLVARLRKQGKMVILQSYDISKFFDKEKIEDAAMTCLNRGADPKAVRLWF